MDEEKTTPTPEEAPDTPAAETAEPETFTVTKEQMEKMEALAAQLAAQQDKFLRLAAEYDNYRKRTAKEKEAIYADAKIDTVTALLPTTDHLLIRIAGIDAPESRQDFGTRSRQLLSRLVKGRIVQAEAVSRDRYGRYVSILTVDGADVGLAMIGSGLAWAYRDYLKDLPDGYAEAYEQAENEARRSGRGLWGAPYPMEPWKWRRVYRQMQEKSRGADRGG